MDTVFSLSPSKIPRIFMSHLPTMLLHIPYTSGMALFRAFRWRGISSGACVCAANASRCPSRWSRNCRRASRRTSAVRTMSLRFLVRNERPFFESRSLPFRLLCSHTIALRFENKKGFLKQIFQKRYKFEVWGPERSDLIFHIARKAF